MRRVLSVAVGAALIAAVPASASAAPPDKENGAERGHAHDHPSPLSDKQRALRAEAASQVLEGEATARGDNKVVQVAKGQYVELAQEGKDTIWTVLGEFPDLAHNEIPAPDRAVDNTTIWTSDFTREHYQRMLHDSGAGVNSVANFYEEQSSGRYTVEGTVEDWVEVPEEGAYYGSNDKPDSATWEFVADTIDTWYAEQLADGKTVDEINAYLSRFDVWDRYDHDGDGDFDEADGYIDHFQAVHSGEGEEVGGGKLGDAAIWSHRWYVQYGDIGKTGPTLDDGTQVQQGGTRVGGSKYWVGDYTVEPENGGVGVFAHEFGHDLGLPDLYDTSGNSGGAENSTGFWSLMSSGSYGNNGAADEGIGMRPTHMGVWEKFHLGWLNYEVARTGQRSSHRLGPASTNTRQAQALFTVLPKRQVTVDVGDPFEGEDFWYSGSGDDLDNTLLAAKPAGAQQLTAKVEYDIEVDWDYAYAGYVLDGAFVPLDTNLSTDADPNGQNFDHGITGDSGGEYVDLTVDLTGVPAEATQIGFRYWTDGAVAEPGLLVDAVAVDGTPVTDWTLDGFERTSGTSTKAYDNYYVAEYRTYRGYDAGLKTGPYNFGDPAKENWAERFPYQDGLLISYWNTQYTDNNVGDHPGAGEILPIDAHPGLLVEPTDDATGDDEAKGPAWRARVQTYDSTFGLERTDQITLHDPESGKPGTYGGLPAVPVFDDRKDWYVAPGEEPEATGWAGVDVPETGTRISVVSTGAQGSFMQVNVD